jgi:hypothetical protein
LPSPGEVSTRSCTRRRIPGALGIDAEGLGRDVEDVGGGFGGVVLAGKVVAYVAGGGGEVGEAQVALQGDGAQGEVVVVGFPRPVGAQARLEAGGGVLAVHGAQALDGGRDVDPPRVVELDASGEAAAGAGGLVHVGKVQRDVVEVAALQIVIGHRAQGGPIIDDGGC